MKLLELLATEFVLASGNTGHAVLLPPKEQRPREICRIRFKREPDAADMKELVAYLRSQGRRREARIHAEIRRLCTVATEEPVIFRE